MKTAAFLIFLIASAALAGQPGKESREHFVVSDRSQYPLYYATTVDTVAEDQMTNIILLKNAVTGQQLVVKVHTDYKSHISTAEYTLDKKAAATVRAELPFLSATTLHESIAENRLHKDDFRSRDVPITVVANGRSEQLSEKRWKKGDRDSIETKSRVKSLVDPTLAAVLKTAVTVLSFPQLASACSTIPFVTGGATCMPNTAIMCASIPPDCKFDAEFGMSCSAEQLQKAKKVKDSGQEGRY